MSSVINRNKDQIVCEGIVEVVPPYHNDIESFDNPDEFPDLEFVVAGMERPLQLHRRILAESSGKVKAVSGEGKGQRLEWPYNTTNEVDREALVKVLRFCYGETQTVGTKSGECIAMIVAFTRLQVTGLDDVVTLLSNFAMDEAKRNLEIGAALLKACAGYKETSDTSQLALDKKLAATVHIPLIAKDFENFCNLQFEDVSEFRRCCQYNFSENEKDGNKFTNNMDNDKVMSWNESTV